MSVIFNYIILIKGELYLMMVVFQRRIGGGWKYQAV